MTVDDLVKAVQEHAKENYDKDGWDYIVETYTDEELAKEIGKCTTVEGAIKKIRSIAMLLGERRSDVQGTAW